MKVLVPIKRVIDYNVKVKAKSDESGVDLANVKMAINPFCEIAVEEAVRLQESGKASEVIAVSIGTTASQEQLRTALALGADRAILVETDIEVEPLGVAKLLKAVVEKENPDLVILGKQAIDDDSNQTGQMLAGIMQWPQGAFASKIEINGKDLSVTREIDGGLETLNLKLPCIITTDLRLNEPRYASLPNIMKAKRKEIVELSLSDLGIEYHNRLEVLKVAEPKIRSEGKKLEDVDELVRILKDEVGVT